MKLSNLHEIIRRDFILQQRLQKKNKGINFFNINSSTEQGYKIDVMLEIHLDLKETRVNLHINTDLPFMNCWKSYDFDSFVKEFKEWALLPYYIPRQCNRKDNKMSRW